MSGFETLLGGDLGHRIEFSESVDDAKRKVDECAAEGFDTLWMGGGDGTIHVLLNHAFGAKLNYGVVPMGTVNAFAKALGTPGDPVEAAKWLLRARPMPMDVGDMNGRKFLCFAGVGFDARAVHGVSNRLKSWVGRLAYAAAGVSAVGAMGKLAEFTISFPGGKSETARSLIMSNVPNYAGFSVFHDVTPASGNMELFLFRRNNAPLIVGWLGASWLRSESMRKAFASVGHYMAEEFALTSKTPLFLQLDGEAVNLGDDCEYHYKCLPSGISVLMH